MADSPKGPFTYGGVLVDIGDLYLNGNEDETHASNYLGNTHGEMLPAHAYPELRKYKINGISFIIDRQIVVLMQDRHVQKNWNVEMTEAFSRQKLQAVA